MPQFNSIGLRPGIGGAGRGGALASEYLGQVATRGIYPDFRSNAEAYKQQQATRAVRVLEDVGANNPFKLAFPTAYNNVLWDTSASVVGDDRPPGGSASITASVEYPDGVFTPLAFGGLSTGTMPATIGLTWTDLCSTLEIAGRSTPGGVWVKVHSFITFAAGGNPIYRENSTTQRNEAIGDRLSMAISGLTDHTGTGGINSNQSATRAFGPVLFVANTRLASGLMDGDSRSVGVRDGIDSSGDLGEISRSIGAANIPYTEIGAASDRLVYKVGGVTTTRQEIMTYCSFGISEAITNDACTASRTLEQIQADVATWTDLIKSKVVDGKCGVTTTSPRTTGSWATLGGQTPITGTDTMTAYNQWLRGGGLAGVYVYDTCAANESSQDSQLWAVSPVRTVDGTHGNQAACLAIVSGGYITTADFAR